MLGVVRAEYTVMTKTGFLFSRSLQSSVREKKQ